MLVFLGSLIYTLKVKENMGVILMGGSSHTGKSTVARAMGKRLSCSFLSTDSLARHPGRPWKPNPADIPPHVVEHYATLPVEALFDDVLRHYRGVWSIVQDIIAMVLQDPFYDGLIIEGSAIWPGFVANSSLQHTQALWLTADNDLFQERIYRESDYVQKSEPEKALIDKFTQRSQYFNQKMMVVIQEQNLQSIKVSDAMSPQQIAQTAIELLAS